MIEHWNEIDEVRIWEESWRIVQKQASWRGVPSIPPRSPFYRHGVRVPPLALGVVAAGIDGLAVLPSYFILHQQFHTSAMAFRRCQVASELDSCSIELDEPSKHGQAVRHPCRLVGHTVWERRILRSAG